MGSRSGTLSPLFEETVNKHVRNYFQGGRVPFQVLVVATDSGIMDICDYPDGYPGGSAALYIGSEPGTTFFTLTLNVEFPTGEEEL